MDPYDEEILNVLKDRKPRNFQQILDEIGFSHNTLSFHLNSLVDEGLISRKKTPSGGRGRPVYLYTSVEASTTASGASGELLVLTFSELKRICRHSRGGRCRETKARCEPDFCPHIRKKD